MSRYIFATLIILLLSASTVIGSDKNKIIDDFFLGRLRPGMDLGKGPGELSGVQLLAIETARAALKLPWSSMRDHSILLARNGSGYEVVFQGTDPGFGGGQAVVLDDNLEVVRIYSPR